jgi:hypothetical protein
MLKAIREVWDARRLYAEVYIFEMWVWTLAVFFVGFGFGLLLGLAL